MLVLEEKALKLAVSRLSSTRNGHLVKIQVTPTSAGFIFQVPEIPTLQPPNQDSSVSLRNPANHHLLGLHSGRQISDTGTVNQ